MKKLSVCLLAGVLLISSVFPGTAFAASDSMIPKDGITKVPMEEKISGADVEMISQEELSKAEELAADSVSSNKKGPRNTVNDAITVQTDTVYSTTIPSDNSVWIKVNTVNKKKLTMVVQFNNSVDFITNIYELTNPTTLTRVEQSRNFTDKADAVSFIPNGGWYYIQINYLSGDRNVNFLVETSNQASAREPNDSVHQADTYNDYINVIDTFDNYRDQDWSILNVTSPGRYYIALMFRKAYQGAVYVELIDLETGSSQYIHQSAPIFAVYTDLPKAGKYAVRATSDKEMDPTNEYVLTVAKEDAVILPDSAELTGITAIDGNVSKLDEIYAVSGSSIRVSGNLTRKGSRCKNVPVIVCLEGRGLNNIKTRAGITSSNGEFMLDPNLPAGPGIYLWGSDYYSLNSLAFYDYTGKQIGNRTWTLWNFN